MKNNNMKRATTMLLGAILSASFIFTSCGKMMEVDSDRQAFEPNLDSKTDSVFYAFGIAQGMQVLADQYFFQGEMRGELVKATQYADSTLRQLKDFSAGLSNKYDSAYVYYSVINNCNYYLTHRKMDLYTGSTQVTVPEYAAVLAFRAWAYLQLCRNYGSVPFFTEPLTTISQIDDNTYPLYDIRQVTDALAPELSQYTKIDVPNYGTDYSIGTSATTTKRISTKNIFIPAGVILGDLYLESAQSVADYEKAARSYADYLITTKTTQKNLEANFALRNNMLDDISKDKLKLGDTYLDIFNIDDTHKYVVKSAPSDIITYIPMAVSKVNGSTTNVPKAFGYDYYSLQTEEDKFNENIPLVPSYAYKNLTDNLTYYYASTSDKVLKSGAYGDMRSLAIMRTKEGNTTLEGTTEDINWIDKFQSGNIILYRVSTVYLHMAEALNRMGLPDLAFGIMKEGRFQEINTATWVSNEAKKFLDETFCNTATTANNDFNSGTAFGGIHQHGAGAVSDGNSSTYGKSLYQFGTEITNKADTLNKNTPALCPAGFATRLGNSKNYSTDLAAYEADPTLPAPVRNNYEPLLTKADTTFVMEELLCDEEAMEFCFEGSRWYDLMRFAHHKNVAGNNGNAWIANKVKDNNPVKDLTVQQNWYLPFKK